MSIHNQLCIRFLISGKVQGVWFRAGVKKEAEELNITGYTRNLSDGRVEVLACGEQEALIKLNDWLKHGPTLARVSDVTSEALPWQVYETFDIIS